MNATFYKNFSKKFNSTKRPTGTGYTHSVKMKYECSVSKPTFLIENVELDYNYCVFNDRYYFIKDITLNNNNIYEITCDIDVLATYRPYIYSYNTFVEQSASEHDDYLVDKNLSIRSGFINVNTVTQALSTLYFNLDSTHKGCYVIPVLGAGGFNIFMTDYIEDFKVVYDPTIYGASGIQDFFTRFNAGLQDVQQFMGQVIWTPFSPVVIQGSGIVYHQAGGMIAVGSVPITLEHEFYHLSDRIFTLTEGRKTITKPTLYYNDFRDMDRNYTIFSLYLAGVGDVEIDPVYAGNPNLRIEYEYSYNIATGDIRYRLYAIENEGLNPKEYFLGTYSGALAYVIPWGDNQWGYKGVLQGIISNGSAVMSGAGGGGRTGNLVGGSGGIMYGAVFGAVNAQIEHISTTALDFATSHHGSVTGGSGSLSIAKDANIRFTVFQHDTAGSPNGVMGKPLHQNRQLGTLSGYIKCGNASLDIAGFEDEKKILNNFLNSGFYYE